MNPTGPSAVGSGRCAPIKIDLLRAAEWQDLRSARLAAVADSPDALVATLDEESSRPTAEWIASLTGSTWVVAREGYEVVGIACLTAADPRGPEERFIESVWVSPRHRRRGLVRRMLKRLEERARAEGAERLQLWVLETNETAYDAYRRLEYHPVPGHVQHSLKPRHDGTFVHEHLLVKPLLS